MLMQVSISYPVSPHNINTLLQLINSLKQKKIVYSIA